MAKKKVKTNFGKINPIHKNEMEPYNPFHPSSRQPDDLDDMPLTDSLWQGIEDVYNEEKAEAEWITQIRDYCRDNQILPTHLIEAHKMLQQIPDT